VDSAHVRPCGEHPAIVDDDIFERAQRQLKRWTRAKKWALANGDTALLKTL